MARVVALSRTTRNDRAPQSFELIAGWGPRGNGTGTGSRSAARQEELVLGAGMGVIEGKAGQIGGGGASGLVQGSLVDHRDGSAVSEGQ
jgi:hypothetical protein